MIQKQPSTMSNNINGCIHLKCFKTPATSQIHSIGCNLATPSQNCNICVHFHLSLFYWRRLQDQGNLQKEQFILIDVAEGQTSQCQDSGSRKPWWLEQDAENSHLNHSRRQGINAFKASLQGHTFSSKAIPPKPSQTRPTTGGQGVKGLRL